MSGRAGSVWVHGGALVQRRACGIALLAGCLLASCASPEPDIFALASLPGTTVTSAFSNIEVRQPGLAGYLDRSDIVRKLSDYQLSTNSQQRWAAPLGDMIGRVLAADLSQRLLGSSVYTETGAISADPGARVEVDIRRFDPDSSGTLVLEAAYAIEMGSGHRPLAARDVRLTAAAGVGAAQQVAAMSHLLAQLADRIAGDLSQAPRQP